MWIAFIFQYLWDTKQPSHFRATFGGCCELLSFFSIFGIQNNYSFLKCIVLVVVNCFGYAESPCFPFARFHFSVSLGYKTTLSPLKLLTASLWIAFIFQYLWDTKQLPLRYILKYRSCELLSFFSIFGIQNNDFTW